MPDINVCPECRQGKHVNCDGTAWDDERDDVVACGCNLDGHPTTGEAEPDCRYCTAGAFVCTMAHADGRGPRLHCKEAFTHDVLLSDLPEAEVERLLNQPKIVGL